MSEENDPVLEVLEERKEERDFVTEDTLRLLVGHTGLYGILRKLLQISQEECEKMSDAGNMEAVIHGDTVLLMNALRNMQRCNYSVGGAMVRQLDEIKSTKCHK